MSVQVCCLPWVLPWHGWQAWSSIVYSLIPNIRRLETHLDEFCGVCGADEVVLFERATFLVISHATHKVRRALSFWFSLEGVVAARRQPLRVGHCPSVGSAWGVDMNCGCGCAPLQQPHGDIHRFEKISNIIKQFKLSCSKMQSQFQGMMVGNSSFTAYVDSFTSNTYVMIILSNPLIRTWIVL